MGQEKRTEPVLEKPLVNRSRGNCSTGNGLFKKRAMEKEKSKKTRADRPRMSNKENITENGKVVASKRNENAVHEKEPLAVQNRQPRNARKPAFLTQNNLFD